MKSRSTNSKNSTGGSTSAGKMNQRSGTKYNIKRDPWYTLRAEIDAGFRYFWSKRP
jgi:hypothetical protein